MDALIIIGPLAVLLIFTILFGDTIDPDRMGQ